MSNDFNASRLPIVNAKDGEAFANSRDVAAFFDKEHRNVLQSIGALIAAEPQLAHAEFSAGVYTLENTGNQQHRHFDMTRDGFALLAMGFTGTKALKWKLRYIEAFNAMEAEIRRQAQTGPMIDMNDPGALRGLLLSYSEKAIELQEQVNELVPSKEALERIEQSDGSLCVTDAAKTLQMPPQHLFRYLRANSWTYRRVGTAGDIGYQDKIQSGYLEHKVTLVPRADGTEKSVTQVRITPKGLAKLAKIFDQGQQAA
jgi:Rha family phage regulatory protein